LVLPLVAPAQNTAANLELLVRKLVRHVGDEAAAGFQLRLVTSQVDELLPSLHSTLQGVFLGPVAFADASRPHDHVEDGVAGEDLVEGEVVEGFRHTASASICTRRTDSWRDRRRARAHRRVPAAR
ncbi:hypothetical protein CN983_28585, partial [Bacillus cereus]